MLPPTNVCRLAPIFPKIDRERTVMPRTTPNGTTFLLRDTPAAAKPADSGGQPYKTTLAAPADDGTPQLIVAEDSWLMQSFDWSDKLTITGLLFG